MILRIDQIPVMRQLISSLRYSVLNDLHIILIAFLIWNIMVFVIYAYDKWRARRKQYRIPEITLIALAFAGGGIGALLGIFAIRHKTRHIKFRILIPLAALIQAGIAFLFLSNG